MKNKINKINKISTALISLCLLSSSAQAAVTLPTEIKFTNETSLSLATSVAGLPGNGIAPNITKAVPYGIVVLGCSSAGTFNNCTIEFADKATGEKVAMVKINAATATLVQPPAYYGNYGNEFEVLGWQDTPIKHITITKKKG